jgi:hypothetical protein
VNEPTIHVAWPAWNELLAADWRDDRELACGLLGHTRPDGGVHVEHVVEPRSPRGGRNWASLDMRTWIAEERFATRADSPGRHDQLVVGTLHNHLNHWRASPPDFNIWTRCAAATGYAIAGVIITAPETRWEGGFPAGQDWANPELRGWITWPDGDCVVASILVEEEEDFRLRRFREDHAYQPPGRTHAT